MAGQAGRADLVQKGRTVDQKQRWDYGCSPAGRVMANKNPWVWPPYHIRQYFVTQASGLNTSGVEVGPSGEQCYPCIQLVPDYSVLHEILSQKRARVQCYPFSLAMPHVLKALTAQLWGTDFRAQHSHKKEGMHNWACNCSLMNE